MKKKEERKTRKKKKRKKEKKKKEKKKKKINKNIFDLQRKKRNIKTYHVCAFGKYKSGVCLAPSVTGLCTLNFCLNSAAVGGK